MRLYITCLIVFILSMSCSGILYEGEPRNLTDNTVDITIIIEDDMWNGYLAWLEAQE